MRICFTGGLDGMTRRTATQLARDAGYSVTNHVNRNTDYLIAAGKSLTGGSEKLAKAKKLGVTVLSEREFMAMV